MKIIRIFLGIAITTVALNACKKNDAKVLPYNAYGVSQSQGFLKIVYASAYSANPTVLLKVNGLVVSNLITGRIPFPGGGFNTPAPSSNYALYLSVSQGADTIAVVRPKVGTNIDSIELYKTIVTIPDNGAYTLHISDTMVSSTVNNTISLLVKNDISNVDSGYARYRFVNLIPNVATPNGAVDLYLNGVKLDSNVAYKAAGKPFTIKIGANAPGVTDPNSIPIPTWTIRPTGAAATTTALASYASANTITNQRVFTVFAMGYVGATANRLPYVAFTLDKNY